MTTSAAESGTYFTVEEAAAYLRLSPKTIKRAIYSERLPAKKSAAGGGGKVLISRAALDAFFDDLDDA